MPRHAAGGTARLRWMKNLSRRFRRSRFRCWFERLFAVSKKARALVLGATGVAIISMTIAAFVVTNPYAASANEIPSLWIDPGTMTVLPYYEKVGDRYPIGYVVTDSRHSNVCVMVEDDAAYTCQQVDLRR